MLTSAVADPIAPRSEELPSAVQELPSDFNALYDKHFAFVWRNLQRLGVPAAQAPDASQDVFVVVFRRLPEYEPRASFRAWLFAIVASVARTHRRTLARKTLSPAQDPDTLGDDLAPNPEQTAERSEAVVLLEQLLARLSEDQREVFVLAELEQMTGAEIAQALGINPNTVYSRLRAARREFEQALARQEASQRCKP